jgi:hypothetical protein
MSLALRWVHPKHGWCGLVGEYDRRAVQLSHRDDYAIATASLLKDERSAENRNKIDLRK